MIKFLSGLVLGLVVAIGSPPAYRFITTPAPPLPEPKFHHQELVRVTGGYYTGQRCRIRDRAYRRGRYEYVLESLESYRVPELIPEESLELAE